MRLRSLVPALLAATLGASPALAYNELVHHTLTGRAFEQRTDWTQAPLAPPRPEDLAAFRELVWKSLSETPDVAQRAAFLARFPTAQSFDAWSFKEFFMLDPAATVHGFDATKDEAATSTRGALLQSASRWPDDDERNRHRYLRDSKHDIVHDAWGRPLPFDPITLTLGSLSGTSSQGHAHYALADPPLSDDPRVLMKDPAHFAVPAWTRAFGGEFAQLYADLALLARVNNAPQAPWLEATFAGASFHHIQDTANQIHTLQVGPFGFFRAAILQLLKREVLTQGGLLGERTTLNALGLRIISNHHLLLEDLFAKRVKESIEGHPQAPEVSAALAGLGTDDTAFAASAKAKIDSMPPGRFAHGLVKALVLEGGVEGPEAYRLIWRLSIPSLHDGRGYEYDGAKGDDPDKFVDVTGPEAQATLEKFYELESKGLHRATTAQRMWLDAFEAEARLPDARARASARILSVLLPYHLERAQRSQAYVADPPAAQQKIAWVYPGITLALVLLIAWRFRKKPSRRSSSGLLEKMP